MPSTDKMICRNLMLHRELMIVCCRPPLVMTTVIGKGGKMSTSTHEGRRSIQHKDDDTLLIIHHSNYIHLRGFCTCLTLAPTRQHKVSLGVLYVATKNIGSSQ